MLGITFLANSVSYSCFLIIMSIGLVLIFSILGIVNFAHAIFFELGAFIGYTTITWLNNPSLIFLSIIFSAVIVGVIGVLFEVSLLKRAYGMGEEYQILLTFGAILAGVGIERMIWGSTPRTMLSPFGNINGYPVYNLLIVIVAAIVVVILMYILNRTRFGREIRAVASNEEVALNLGINVRRIQTITFGIGAALAGLAGALMIPIMNATPEMGVNILILSFIVIVVGGLGSLRGAIIGSFVVGIARTFGINYFPKISFAVAYIVLVGVLILRPSGIYGEEET